MTKANKENLSAKRIRKKMTDMPDKGHQTNAYWTTFSPPTKRQNNSMGQYFKI